ncbi:hypothetical protein ACQQ2N_18590 [Dokdonella sp. MW10]|uniref:hypothetical protein n=1 Tax=Dokdonella sp. MW10 TaxID=2992926 RepID=UPI003F7D5A0E
MKIAFDLLRALIGIIAGVAVMGAVPIYSEPFLGCQVRGFATLMKGCSVWPDFIAGLATVLVVTVIGPARFRPQLRGLVLVATVVVLGGLAAIKSGMHPNLSRPAEMVFYWEGAGLALFLGGLTGSGIALYLSHLLKARERRAATSNQATHDRAPPSHT